MSTLYPEIVPYETGMLYLEPERETGHVMYWEASGNPQGIPIVFLHGGPGSGSAPWQRRLFNPERYKIILYDQRGAGKSTPHCELRDNTTAHLISDLEVLRQHLNVDHWHVSGGSWGATLALAYAANHPHRVKSLCVYGVFLGRSSELRNMYFSNGVTHQFHPEVFEEFLNALPIEDQHDPIIGYAKAMQDPNRSQDALYLWTKLEKMASKLIVDKKSIKTDLENSDYVSAHSLIENHYFQHECFVDGDQLLTQLSKTISKNCPVDIIQGRYDLICPPETAWALHKAIPHSALHFIEAAGHTAKEQETTQVLKRLLNLRA